MVRVRSQPEILAAVRQRAEPKIAPYRTGSAERSTTSLPALRRGRLVKHFGQTNRRIGNTERRRSKWSRRIRLAAEGGARHDLAVVDPEDHQSATRLDVGAPAVDVQYDETVAVAGH